MSEAMTAGRTALAFAKSVVSDPQTMKLAFDKAQDALGKTPIVGSLAGLAKLATGARATIDAHTATLKMATGVDVRAHVAEKASALFGDLKDKAVAYTGKFTDTVNTHMEAAAAVKGTDLGFTDKAKAAFNGMKAHLTGDGGNAASITAQATGAVEAAVTKTFETRR